MSDISFYFRADGFFDLRDIPGDQDDEHIYASAMEDNGSFTSYSSIRTFKSRPSLVTVNDEVMEKISVTSKVSKMSSGSSSSSSSAYSAQQEVSEVHEAVIIDSSEPVYVNMEKAENIYVGQTEDIYANVSKVSHVQPTPVETKYESYSSSDSSDNEPIISSPDSSDSESDEGDVIIAEHTAAGDTIEQEIANIIDKHMPILEYDLGNDIDWPQKINELEHEINMSERRFSHSSNSSGSTALPDVRDSIPSNTNLNTYDRPVSVLDNHQHQNKFSFDKTSASSSSSIVEIERPSSEHVMMGESVLVIESPTFNSTELDNRQVTSHSNLQDPVITQQHYVSHQRSQSSTSNTSSDSSSSSNSPSKTIAEVDLSIPLSAQIFTEVESQNSNANFTQYMHGYGSMSGDLRGSNGYMYQIQEEGSDKDVERKIEVMSASESSLSSDEEMDRKSSHLVTQNKFVTGQPESPLVMRKATPVAYHSSEDNASPMVIRKATRVVSHSSDENASPMIIKKATKIIDHSSDDNASPMVIRKATPVIHRSSDENESPMLIKKATPIIHHSSDESEESYENVKQMKRVEEVEDDEDDNAFEDNELNLTDLIKFENGKEKPKTKPMRGSNSLNVPRNYDRMERISEASENSVSRKSSHQSSDEDFRHSGKTTHGTRNRVRRNSSGITSSSFISNLSADYESVYSKQEDAKRKSRASAYKNFTNEEESAA